MLKFVLPLLLGLALAPCPCEEETIIGGSKFNLNEWKVYVDVGSTGTEPMLYRGTTCLAKSPIKSKPGCGFTGETTQMAKIPYLVTPLNLGASFTTFTTELENSFTRTGCGFKALDSTFNVQDVLGTGDCVKTCLKKMPWLFFATAGMREDAQADEIFRALENAMTNAGYNVQAIVLAGVIEGELGFLANRGKPRDIYIEQGGASMQVSFQCPPTMCTDAKRSQQPALGSFIEVASQTRSRNGLQTKLQSKLQGYVSKRWGTPDCFFSTSWMGMGLDQLIAVLIHEADNPEYCLQAGVELTPVPGREEWQSNCDPFKPDAIAAWQSETKYVGSRLPTGPNEHKIRTAPIQASVPAGSGESQCQAKLDQCLAAIHQLFDQDNDKQMRGADDSGKATNSFKSILNNMLQQLSQCNMGNYAKNRFLVKGQLAYAAEKNVPSSYPDRKAREAAAIYGTDVRPGRWHSICNPNTKAMNVVQPQTVCDFNRAFGPAIFSGILYVQKVIEDRLMVTLPTSSALQGWTNAMAMTNVIHSKWTNAKGDASRFIYNSNGKGPQSHTKLAGYGNRDEPEDLAINEDTKEIQKETKPKWRR